MKKFLITLLLSVIIFCCCFFTYVLLLPGYQEPPPGHFIDISYDLDNYDSYKDYISKVWMHEDFVSYEAIRGTGEFVKVNLMVPAGEQRSTFDHYYVINDGTFKFYLDVAYDTSIAKYIGKTGPNEFRDDMRYYDGASYIMNGDITYGYNSSDELICILWENDNTVFSIRGYTKELYEHQLDDSFVGKLLLGGNDAHDALNMIDYSNREHLWAFGLSVILPMLLVSVAVASATVITVTFVGRKKRKKAKASESTPE